MIGSHLGILTKKKFIGIYEESASLKYKGLFFFQKLKYVIIIFKFHMDFFILCSTQENVRQNVQAALLHNIKVNAL